MKITVHCDFNQMGGYVTEYESNGWKVFVDYGELLPSAPVSNKKLEIAELTCGDIRKYPQIPQLREFMSSRIAN